MWVKSEVTGCHVWVVGYVDNVHHKYANAHTEFQHWIVEELFEIPNLEQDFKAWLAAYGSHDGSYTIDIKAYLKSKGFLWGIHRLGGMDVKRFKHVYSRYNRFTKGLLCNNSININTNKHRE